MRVVDELEVGGHILHVGLFEEANATGDAEGDVAAGQLELQLQRVEVRAIEHGHLVQRDALVA